MRSARIALVVDAPHSDGEGIARSIVPMLARKFDVEVLYLSDYESPWVSTSTPGTALELFHELFCGAYDIVHTFVPTFPERVFDPAIAADPSLHSSERVLKRVLRLPLTLSIHDAALLRRPDELDRVRESFAMVGAGHFVTGPEPAAWGAFFDDVLEAAREEKGAMSEGAVWERVKAWSARVGRVLGAEGAR